MDAIHRHCLFMYFIHYYRVHYLYVHGVTLICCFVDFVNVCQSISLRMLVLVAGVWTLAFCTRTIHFGVYPFVRGTLTTTSLHKITSLCRKIGLCTCHFQWYTFVDVDCLCIVFMVMIIFYTLTAVFFEVTVVTTTDDIVPRGKCPLLEVVHLSWSFVVPYMYSWCKPERWIQNLALGVDISVLLSSCVCCTDHVHRVYVPLCMWRTIYISECFFSFWSAGLWCVFNLAYCTWRMHFIFHDHV